MSRTSGSAQWRELRSPILHVVGDRTLYRASASAPLDQITEHVAPLVLHTHEEEPPDIAALEAEFLDQDFVYVGGRNRDWFAFLRDELDVPSVKSLRRAVEDDLHRLASEGLVRQTGDGRWALTKAGIEESVPLRSRFDVKNATVAWVERTVDAAYFEKLVAYMARRCTRSVQFNELEDLVNTYLLNLIRRDGLRSGFLRGLHPSPSDLRAWAYKSALSQWRDEGRDAHTRAFKGCRTERDLREDMEDDAGERSVPSEMQAVFLAADDEGQSGALVTAGSLALPLLDVIGGDHEDEVEHHLIYERGLRLAEAALRREKSGASDRFARIFALLCEDKSFREIGESEGVSRNRAASLVADLRQAMRRAFVTSGPAMRVLQYVRDEPYATFKDIEDDIDEDIDVSILDALVSANRLKREGLESYTITAAGRAALDNNAQLGVDIHLAP